MDVHHVIHLAITIDEYIFEKLHESYSSYLLPYLGSYSVKNRIYEENVNIERDEFVKMQEAGENDNISAN